MEAPGIEPGLERPMPHVPRASASTTPLETYATGEANPPEVGSKSDSERIPWSALAPEIATLAEALRDAAVRGDGRAARKAWAEIGALLAPEAP